MKLLKLLNGETGEVVYYKSRAILPTPNNKWPIWMRRADGETLSPISPCVIGLQRNKTDSGQA